MCFGMPLVTYSLHLGRKGMLLCPALLWVHGVMLAAGVDGGHEVGVWEDEGWSGWRGGWIWHWEGQGWWEGALRATLRS